MANQDPQPEIYTTRHTFTGATAVGTSNTVTVYENSHSYIHNLTLDVFVSFG